MSSLLNTVSKTITGISLGTPFQYNVNYPSQYTNGDTWYSTWADNDVTYISGNDFYNWNGASPTSNMAISSITTFDSSTVGTLVNSMSIFGTQFTTGGSDGATWKTIGLISVNGVLYWFASREVYGSSGTGFIQTALSSQLIKSSDHGVTWTPLPPAGVQPYASPMFTTTKFSTPGFIQYGKDYQGNTAHNSNNYVYAISNDGSWNNGSKFYLGRVLVSNIGNLSAADWSFYIGGDGMSDASWNSSPSSAVSILSSPQALGQTSAQYIPAFDCYVMFGWYYPSLKNTGGVTDTISDTIWTYYVSKTPWGPWEVIGSKEWAPQGYYDPVIIPKSLSGNTAVIACAGDYSSVVNPSSHYTLTLIPITFS